MAALQLAATAPLKKRLWQQVVQMKIINQGACLTLGGGDAAPLVAMARLALKSSTERSAISFNFMMYCLDS